MTQSSKPTVEGLMSFYTDILESLGMEVDESGLISLMVDGQKYPTAIGEKRLVLPTQQVLRNPDWDSFVAFHPLAENVYRGESAVIKKLKKLVNFRLTTVIAHLITELSEIAADKSYHEKLTPKQNELLEYLPKANAKTVEGFTKIVNATSSEGPNRLVNIYLKHGGKYRGEDCFRVAVTSFPVREHFTREDKTIFGVKLASKKDHKSFQDLFDYLLPDSDDLDTYSYGSRSMEAPYFDALMHAYIKVAKQLNRITWLFRRHLDDHEALMINVNQWEDNLKDLSFYFDLVPVLAGNDGEPSVDEKSKQVPEKSPTTKGSQQSLFKKGDNTKARSSAMGRMAEEMEAAANTGSTQAPATPPVAAQSAVPQPAAPQPAEQSSNESSGNGLSWKQVMERRTQGQHQQPQQQTFAPPQYNWQNPMANQAPPGFAGGPVHQPGPMNPQFGFGGGGGNTFANHPRNQPSGGAMSWQQQNWNTGPVYPGGV